MAYTSGTAAGYLALLRAFRDWVTNSAILGNETWIWLKDTTGIAGNADGAVYFRAPGSAGLARVVVEDCEDAWNEYVDTDVISTLDAADYQIGSGSARLVVAAPCAAGDILATEAITSANLAGYTKLAFRIKSSAACASGDLQILLDNTASCASPLELLNVPVLNAGQWTYCEVSFATPSNLTAIISVGIKMVVDKGAFTVWIDDVKATATAAENIYMNFNTVSSVPSDYYNWELNGAIGFDTNVPFATQPGACTRVISCLYTGNIAYRFWANGRRAMIAAMVGGTCSEFMYLGFIKPYAPASVYPYPLMIGATNYQHIKYSDASTTHTWPMKTYYVNPGPAQNSFLRNVSGVWMGLWHWGWGSSYPANVYFTQPYSALNYDYLLVCADGSNPMLPVMVMQMRGTTIGTWSGIGEFDGVLWILGVAIANGDTVTVGSDTYSVVQETSRTTYNSFAAVKNE